jgi:hypothetical protein
MIYNRELVSTRWKIPSDQFLRKVRDEWFATPQKTVPYCQALGVLDEWFRSTSVNDIQSWDHMPCIDLTMGCAHYIESFILGQHGFDNFQVLPDEYAYYGFYGKWGTPLEQLEPNKPLIVTLPHYRWGDLRPEWPDILIECQRKNIEIHIDMAWLTLARDIKIDLSHPMIRSIGMSMSKYDLQWNRVGLRYSKQRRVDSITIFNHFYAEHVNNNIYSCAVFCAERIPRDYLWNTYHHANREICAQLGYQPTKLIHGVKSDDCVLCITDLLDPHRK